MAGETIEIEQIIGPDNLAVEISNRWREWDMFRNKKIEEWKELRNYLYATDTRTTTNAMLPWSNSTTTPKLTQIMDNLHANYFATLFPQQKFMRFEAYTEDSDLKQKTRHYPSIYGKQNTDSLTLLKQCPIFFLYYIQYGNCFATVTFEDNYKIKEDGDYISQYVGPKLVRIVTIRHML
jgi:hypothetical protein